MRRPTALLAVSVVLAAACSGPSAPDGPRAGDGRTGGTGQGTPVAAGPFVRMICEDIPRAYLLRVWRGYRADRSGDIQFIPDFPHYVGTFAAHSGQ